MILEPSGGMETEAAWHPGLGSRLHLHLGTERAERRRPGRVSGLPPSAAGQFCEGTWWL